MVQHLITLILLATSLSFTLEFDMTEQELKSTKGKFCGPNLSDTLSLLCGSVFNTKQKRNNDYFSNQQNEFSDEAFPFRSRHLAKSFISGEFRKRSQGVASECCHKPCSLWEMSGYCGDQ